MTASEKEYGGALYELAAEEHCEDEVLESIGLVSKMFAEEPSYRALLQNPAVPKEERLGLLDKAFGKSIHAYALNFTKILCERRALFELEGCEKAYRERLYEARGILPAVAYSAIVLSDAQMQALQKKIEKSTGKKVLLENKLDASLLGGVKVCYAGKELDGTVSGRLESLRRSLKQA